MRGEGVGALDCRTRVIPEFPFGLVSQLPRPTIRQKLFGNSGDRARPRYHFRAGNVLRGQFEIWR